MSIHTCASFFYTDNYNTFSWIISTFYNALSRTAVPIFFFISGVLLFDESKQYTFKKLYSKIFRFLIITALWVLFYLIFDYVLFRRIPNIANYKYHLWFMFDYIILLILTPILRLICKKENKSIIKYLIIVFVVGYVFISILETFNYINSDFVIVKLIKQVIQFISLFKINQLANCIILAITGWYICSFDVSKLKKYAWFFLLINFITILVVLFLCVNNNNTSAFDYFSNYYNVFTFFTTISLVVVFKYSKFANKDHKYVKKFSNNTFIIYLLHPAILETIFFFCGDWIYSICSSAMAVIYIPILIAVIFGITFLCSMLFLLLPLKIRRWIC